jgi:acyl carrier protein
VAVQRAEVLGAIQEIIRVDLKFSGMEIGDDLELVGGGLGLDSLDLLMLVTGIEKRFGHKIPHKRLNRESMGTVGRFADFVVAELASAGR